MIRKLNISHIDRVIAAANNGTLEKVTIYKGNKGKNNGIHMIDYTIYSDSIPGTVVSNDTHAQFIRSARQIRRDVISEDYAEIELNYDVATKTLKYRIIGKKE